MVAIKVTCETAEAAKLFVETLMSTACTSVDESQIAALASGEEIIYEDMPGTASRFDGEFAASVAAEFPIAGLRVVHLD